MQTNTKMCAVALSDIDTRVLII